MAYFGYAYTKANFGGGFGFQSHGSAATPPVNTVAPVASGVGIVGQTLSTTNGTWTGTATITYTYQWQYSSDGGSNWNNVASSGTSATYVVAAAYSGYLIKCVVTGTNGVGSSSASSNSISIVYTILDVITTAAFAFAFILLRGAYYGSNCISIRRSGDDAEQAFGFTANGIFDFASAIAWVVAGGGTQNGYIVTSYEQSGNNRHVTQSTPANQPQIIASGALVALNSLPASYYDGVNDTMKLISSGTSTNNTWVSIHKLSSLTGYRTIMTYGAVNGANRVNFMKFITTNKRVIYDDSGANSVDGDATTSQEIWVASSSSGSVKMWVNGTSQTITNNTRTLTSNLNSIQFGSDVYNDLLEGYIQLEILWQSTVSDADIAIFTTKLKTIYGIA